MRQPYRHSGIVPASGALMALAAGSLAALVLGVAYAFSFYHILHVYLNVLLTFAFGAGVGWTVGFVAREGKIRNVPAVGALAIAAALVGIYAEWGATGYAMLDMGKLQQAWRQLGVLPFLPHNIVWLAIELYKNGSWGMTANAPVHGPPLAVLWLVEAGIIIAVAVGVAVQQIAELPFCEGCDEWVVRQEPHLYAGHGYESVWSDVQHGVFESLAQTPRAAGNEQHFIRVYLSSCPKCAESNYLSVVACEVKVNPKGGRYLAQTKIATNVPLTATQVEIVEAAAFIAPAIGSDPDPLRSPGDWTSNTPPAWPASESAEQPAVAGPVAGEK